MKRIKKGELMKKNARRIKEGELMKGMQEELRK